MGKVKLNFAINSKAVLRTLVLFDAKTNKMIRLLHR